MRILKHLIGGYEAAVRAPATGSGRKVLAYESELERITELTLQYPEIETGGSVFGYWTHSGSPVVAFATGPGVNSQHNRTSFYQSESFLLNRGTNLYDRYGMQHIGEWHSHHKLGLNEPSGGDISTVISGMRQKQWRLFLLLITTISSQEKGIAIHNYFLFSEDDNDIEPLRIIQLPGKSPYRNQDSTRGEEDAVTISPMAWIPGPHTPGATRSSEQAYPNSWISTDSCKSQLAKIARDFEAADIAYKILPVDDGNKVKISLHDMELLIGPDFSQHGPEILGDEAPSESVVWSPSMDLVEWYLRQAENTN